MFGWGGEGCVQEHENQIRGGGGGGEGRGLSGYVGASQKKKKKKKSPTPQGAHSTGKKEQVLKPWDSAPRGRRKTQKNQEKCNLPTCPIPEHSPHDILLLENETG